MRNGINREQRAMSNEQRKKITVLLCSLLFALCYLILFVACDNNLKLAETETPVEIGYGKISVSFAGETADQNAAARTAWPAAIFDKYVYTFTKAGETTGTEKAPDNNGLFTLEVGAYTVAVQAYTGDAGSYNLAASGVSASFNVSTGSNNQVRVTLSGVAAAGKGEFSYTITYPENVSDVTITLQKWPGMNSISVNPAAITGGNGKTQTLQLDAGTYLLTALIGKNSLWAGISEAVHIYPSLATAYEKDFNDTDLLPPQTPVAADFDVGNLLQSDKSIAAVTVTPKLGKSSGAVTVYYAGTGSTAYARSAAVPTTAGTYALTFDVAAAIGWNTATGLSGGTLTIREYIAFTSVSALTTWLDARPANTAAKPYYIALNVNSLGSLSYTLNANKTKFVSLDLSGSTFDSIGYIAFMDCTSLTSVTIPNSVTSIGNLAFMDCTSLTSVTISASVTSIGSYAFEGCTSLTSITIPDSVTSFGNYAFADCTSLASVTIGNSVASIGGGAFYNCTSLTSVTIGNGVTSIGESAFNGCTSLASVTIPNSVTSIGNSAFAGCTRLTSATFGGTIPSANFNANAFDGNLRSQFYAASSNGRPGRYTRSSGSSIWSFFSTTFTSINSLDAWLSAQPANTAATPYAVALNVNYIGSDSITNGSLGYVLKQNSTKYVSLDLSGSTFTSIWDGAFYNCTSLTNIIIPNSVTSIGELAFALCYNLTSITIPDSVTSIGEGAFGLCYNLTSITIPNSVTTIGVEAFALCSSLTAIDVHVANTVYTSVDGVLYNRNKTTLVAYPVGKTGAFTIPHGVTSIGDGAFEDCTSLIGVTIPDSVTSIGDGAFYGCTGLTGVIIPNSVTSIGSSAFENCTSLISVTIPYSVTSIWIGAFSSCDSLTKINVHAANSAFSSVDGVLYNKDKTTLVAYPAGKTYSSFTIPHGVTRIGSMAFVNSSLASVTIPNSVTSIGYRAFSNCSSLASVTIPNSVTNIEIQAFENCTSLTSITIPNSVTSIGAGAFSCTSLTNITIPNSVTSIGGGAFSDCSSLARVTFLGTIPLANFPTNAFSGNLRARFYANNASNGTPGTYTTTAPVSSSSVWTRQ